jgi:hypothetical protein
MNSQIDTDAPLTIDTNTSFTTEELNDIIDSINHRLIFTVYRQILQDVFNVYNFKYENNAMVYRFKSTHCWLLKYIETNGTNYNELKAGTHIPYNMDLFKDTLSKIGLSLIWDVRPLFCIGSINILPYLFIEISVPL